MQRRGRPSWRKCISPGRSTRWESDPCAFERCYRQEYVLTLVPLQELQQRQLSYHVLDEASALKQEEWYLIARERRRGGARTGRYDYNGAAR